MINRWFIIVALFIFAMSAHAKHQVILDTDTGLTLPFGKGHVDDASAIWMLLNSPEVDLLGITEVSGNVWVDQGVENALKLLKMADRTNIPVYRGARLPLVHDVLNWEKLEKLASGYSWRGALSPWETNPKVSIPSYKEHAVQYLLETVNKHPNEITIVAIGPLTNLALAMRLDETFASKIKHLIIMGGSFYVGGNSNGAAEFNFWWDPEAAQIVLHSDAKISLIPLDVCYKTQYKKWQFEKIVAAKSKASSFFLEADETSDFPRTIYDAVAIAYLLQPKIFTDIKKQHVEIETSRSISYGQSIAFLKEDIWNGHFDIRPPVTAREVEVVYGVNGDKFDELFVSLLSK